LYYQNANDEFLPAEAAIYQEMLASFTWRGQTAEPLDIPTDWATGYHLAVIWPQLEPVPLSIEEMRPFQEGFEATVTEVDPGRFVVITDDGQTIVWRGRYYFFDGGLAPGQENPPVTAALEPGERVFLVGRPVAVASPAGEQFLDLQYLAIERDGQWQTVSFQTTFDLAYESPDPELLAHYPQDQPLRLRLLGTLEQVAPYLVDEAGTLFAEAGLEEVELTQQLLVHGILQSPDSPQLRLEELFSLEGDCRLIGDYERDCYPWQRLYPPVLPAEITAVVSEVLVDSGIIVLEQPVDGFITITLGEDSLLEIETIQPGQQIHAVGQPGQAGTLLAQEVEVLSQNEP
jgi:hypothetical protein